MFLMNSNTYFIHTFYFLNYIKNNGLINKILLVKNSKYIKIKINFFNYFKNEKIIIKTWSKYVFLKNLFDFNIK